MFPTHSWRSGARTAQGFEGGQDPHGYPCPPLHTMESAHIVEIGPPSMWRCVYCGCLNPHESQGEIRVNCKHCGAGREDEGPIRYKQGDYLWSLGRKERNVTTRVTP